MPLTVQSGTTSLGGLRVSRDSSQVKGSEALGRPSKIPVSVHMGVIRSLSPPLVLTCLQIGGQSLRRRLAYQSNLKKKTEEIGWACEFAPPKGGRAEGLRRSPSPVIAPCADQKGT